MSSPVATKRILIFRPGSLGDTLVSLPMFHLLARRFPAADKRVLCYRPIGAAYASLKSVLDGTNLVQGYFEVDFPSMRHQLRAQLELRRQLRSWQPDLLVYLTMPRSLPRLLAEVMFFKSAVSAGSPALPTPSRSGSIAGYRSSRRSSTRRSASRDLSAGLAIRGLTTPGVGSQAYADRKSPGRCGRARINRRSGLSGIRDRHGDGCEGLGRRPLAQVDGAPGRRCGRLRFGAGRRRGRPRPIGNACTGLARPKLEPMRQIHAARERRTDGAGNAVRRT